MEKNSITVKFKLAKETKNTYQYQEVEVKDHQLVIGALYVKKWFCEGADELTVTITKQ